MLPNLQVIARHPMSYQPIENYGIIGNMRTVALVGMNGSIDWYRYPNFDSPSIFGAILDDNKGGRFQICPIGRLARGCEQWDRPSCFCVACTIITIMMQVTWLN